MSPTPIRRARWGRQEQDNQLPQLVWDEFLDKGRGHNRELCHAPDRSETTSYVEQVAAKPLRRQWRSGPP